MSSWTALGDRAIRFTRPAGVSPRAIVDAVRAWPGVVDVVVAQHDIAAYFDREPFVESSQIAALANVLADDTRAREHTLHAIYDGEDLGSVAVAIGVSTTELIAIHRDATYIVDTLGFAPGFAYLTGLDPRLALPRRATPRPRVPASSIGIAGGFTAVYPFATAGGWHLLGRVVDATLFGPDGALLQLGDRVKFV